MATKSKTSTKRTAKPAAAKPAKVTKNTKVETAKPAATVKTRVTTDNKASIIDRLRRPVFYPKTSFGALLGELFGTFILAAVWLNVSGTAIALLFVLAALTLAGYTLSGSHFNPAISFAAWVTRQISAARMLGYIVAQFLGAMLAIVVVRSLLPIQPAQQSFVGGPASDPVLYTIASLTENREWFIFFAQMLGAAVFGYLFASTFKKDQITRGLTVGFGFYAGLVLAGSFAVINPAVALSIGAYEGLNQFWPYAVYLIAPLLGATVGMALYRFFQKDVDTTEKVAA